MLLDIITPSLNKNQYNMFSLNGFEFKFKKKYYIITVHHNLPIEKVSINLTLPNKFANKLPNQIANNLSTKLELVINPVWNELLILKNPINSINSVNKVTVSLPQVSNKLKIISNNETIEGETLGYTFLPFDNINGYEIPYIMMSIKNTNLEGLSGSPVFMNDKLVGIFSKVLLDKSCALIIPTYILIKTLEKKDNNNIYTVNNINLIDKIGHYKNKNNTIFHPQLQIYIPITSYLNIMGDKYQLLDITYKNERPNNVKMIKYKNNLLNYYNNIISRQDYQEFKITLRLLTLIKKIYPKNMILRKIFYELSINNNIWISNVNNTFCIK